MADPRDFYMDGFYLYHRAERGLRILNRPDQGADNIIPVPTTGQAPVPVPRVFWDIFRQAEAARTVANPQHGSIQDGPPQFPCTWRDCGAIFDTLPKLRRHKDTHTVVPKLCPLCPAGGKLWTRVDKLQMHMLNMHAPFDVEVVRPVIDSMYKIRDGGRGWLERTQALFAQMANPSSNNQQQAEVQRTDREKAQSEERQS
ncbi:hypothetical protein EDC01DRAFT_635861 [Geopyxis carbonaria]|nr:hypothetical protein EDC01DRAFT_635861 [Geopyxis carbonaria]